MKPVTLHALGGEHARKRKGSDGHALPGVETGVEAGDLRQMRRVRHNRTNRREIMLLVQRGQRNQCLQFYNEPVIDAHRGSESRATMHNAVPDCHDSLSRQ